MKKFLLFTFAFCLIASSGIAATLADFEAGTNGATSPTAANSPCYGSAYASLTQVAGNGGNVLNVSDGGYGNGVVFTFAGAVPADGVYTVSAEVQITDPNNNLGMTRSYDIALHEPLCYGFGVSGNGSAVVNPSQVSGMYCAWVPNLTTGDDSGLGFQTVSVTVPLKAGDLWMWFSTMPNYTTSGTGAWSGDSVQIDNISLTAVADGAIKTVGPTGDYATCQAACADIAAGTLANQYIALWIDDATNIVESAQVEFQAASATGTLYVCSDPDNSAMAVLVGAAVNEAWQVDTDAGSAVKFSDLYFIPPYEADGIIGTGANSNLDGFESYCVGVGTVDVYFANCIFTGSQSDGSPTDPAAAWVGGPTQCMWGDDWLFQHSNVKTTFDKTIIAHAYDEALLSYSSFFIFNNSKIMNNGGRGIQDICDAAGSAGNNSGDQTSELIGWSTAAPIEIKDNATGAFTTEQGWTGWRADGNPLPTIARFVNITGNGESGWYNGSDVPLTVEYTNSDNNGSEGFSFWFYTTNPAQRVANMTNCTADNNVGRGLKFGRGTSVTVDSFQSTFNGHRGVDIDLYAGGVYNLTNMTVTDNGEYGFYLDRPTADATVTVSLCSFARNASGGFRINNGMLVDINNCSIIDNGGPGITVTGAAGANPLALDTVAIDGNAGAGLLLNSSAGVVSITGCTLMDNGTGIANGDGTTDSGAVVTVVNSIIAGPGYAFANNNAADASESITLTYSAISNGNHSPDDVDAIFDPAAPNRSANDPFDYSAASVVQIPPQFVSVDPASADYLDVDNSNYGDKADGGYALKGFGDFIGALSIEGWDSY